MAAPRRREGLTALAGSRLCSGTVIAANGGAAQTCRALNRGAAHCLGYNYGQLGNGRAVANWVPVAVTGPWPRYDARFILHFVAAARKGA